MAQTKRNKWIIKISKNNGDVFNAPKVCRELILPSGFYAADPFVIKWQGANYLYFELYDYKKGVIAVQNLDNLDEDYKVVLEEPYHLSFPCVFEDNGKLYIVPESGVNGTIDLYEAETPYTWKKIKTLVEGVCAGDPVIRCYASPSSTTYYLDFTDSGDENLKVYSSDSLLGEWKEVHSRQLPHSRNAGKSFRYNGITYYPKQDSKEYGKRVHFKGIDDKIKKTLEGIHTFNFNDDYIVTDYRIEETLDTN